jgi:acyl-coenzyme A synthetase/AMP-(fatty) acid ligase
LGGATEASIHSTAYEVGETAWTGGYLPYGRPLANQRVFILDDRMMPVPVGVVGEIYLGGVGLARGYLGLDDETKERFVQWSYGSRRSERLYRTGDAGRYHPDGIIEILGRKDFQVKLNGMRVELGEIESILVSHPGVKRAVVVSQPTPKGDTVLVGYVTAQKSGGATSASLFDLLNQRLPRYMIPSSIEVTDLLPLTPNGKVDRQALSSMERGLVKSSGAGENRIGSWGYLVIETWQYILGVDRMGYHDNFFENGGDSFKALRSIVRIDSRLRLTDIFQYPTPSALSNYLADRYGEPTDSTLPVRVSDRG